MMEKRVIVYFHKYKGQENAKSWAERMDLNRDLNYLYQLAVKHAKEDPGFYFCVEVFPLEKGETQ